jgi:hypothetical protein
VDGTSQNAFCRSKRLISTPECYMSTCSPPVCPENGNFYEMYTSGSSFGLKLADPNNPGKFMCEEP